MQQKTGLTFSTESRNLRGRANCNVKRKRHAIQLCTYVVLGRRPTDLLRPSLSSPAFLVNAALYSNTSSPVTFSVTQSLTLRLTLEAEALRCLFTDAAFT